MDWLQGHWADVHGVGEDLELWSTVIVNCWLILTGIVFGGTRILLWFKKSRPVVEPLAKQLINSAVTAAIAATSPTSGSACATVV